MANYNISGREAVITTDLRVKTAVSVPAQAAASRAQRAAEYLPPDWDSLTPEQQATWHQKVEQYFSKPFWAESLSLSPEVDFQAIVQEDMRSFTLLHALHKVAKQHGVSLASHLDAWNYGRGAE